MMSFVAPLLAECNVFLFFFFSFFFHSTSRNLDIVVYMYKDIHIAALSVIRFERNLKTTEGPLIVNWLTTLWYF